MGRSAGEEQSFLHVQRVLMLSFMKGNAPVLAIEIARRAIPLHVRPTFEEMENACRNQPASEAPPTAEVA
jgi:chemotaxis protein MotA